MIARKLKFVYKDQLVFWSDNCGACRLELWLLVDLGRGIALQTHRVSKASHERNGPGSEHQVTVTERSMRQSLLLSWNFGRQRLQPLFGEILRDEG